MARGAAHRDERFAAYIGGVSNVIGHADRVGPLHDYCVGLLMSAERKSVMTTN